MDAMVGYFRKAARSCITSLKNRIIIQLLYVLPHFDFHTFVA